MENANKYKARKVTYHGITFDSQKELERYLYLEYLEKHGVISQLRRQVRFQIIPPLYATETIRHNKRTNTRKKLVDRAAHYTCDFLYRENEKIIIEDVKSEATARLSDYGLRRKLMLRIIAGHNLRKQRDTFEFREFVKQECSGIRKKCVMKQLLTTRKERHEFKPGTTSDDG